MPRYALAIDMGASSGRHVLGWIQDGKVMMEEIYRFPNGIQEKDGRFCWDVDALFGHIVEGMKKCAELHKIPDTVGIDTWGVDYVLLDREGKRLGDAVAYRDNRTKGKAAELESRLPEGADRGQLLSVLWEMGALRPGQVSVQLKSGEIPGETG